MPSVAFTYNGTDTVVATMTGATPAQQYTLSVNDGDTYPADTQTAAGTTLTFTVSTANPASGFTFDVTVKEGDASSTDNFIAGTVYQQGSTSEYSFSATWAFDGVDTISVTGTFPVATYELQLLDTVNGGSNTPFTGTGASQTVTVTTASPAGGAFFYGYVFNDSTFAVFTNRLFTGTVMSSGTPGNPASGGDGGGGGGGGSRQGVAIAFGDDTLAETPTWTYLDSYDNLVAEWDIQRGVSNEFEQADTGRATVTINDPDGLLDPFNSDGPWFGMIEPRLPIKLARQNPISGDWFDRYSGFIDDLEYTESPSQINMRLVISCVGIFSVITRMEMTTPPFGDTNPSTDPGAEGTVFFEDGPVNTRIEQILGDADIPGDRSIVFTGNVDVQETTYSAGESPMTALQEAADAEFPMGVSKLYEDRLGRFVFHGRFARFDPVGTAEGADWDYHAWKAGDGAAVAASITDTAQIRAYAFNRGLDRIVNACRITYFNIPRADVNGMVETDTGSITSYGLSSLSADDLIIKGGKDINVGDPEAECRAMSEWVVANYKDPQNRITDIKFMSLAPTDPRAAPVWDLLCEIDISDHITVTVSHPASAGMVDEEYVIDGVTESQKPLNPDYDLVELSLNVSPVGVEFPVP